MEAVDKSSHHSGESSSGHDNRGNGPRRRWIALHAGLARAPTLCSSRRYLITSNKIADKIRERKRKRANAHNYSDWKKAQKPEKAKKFTTSKKQATDSEGLAE